MKIGMFVFALFVGSMGTAHAADIKGKWGIGAGFTSGTGGEISLIRGRSDHSAWALDFAMSAFKEKLEAQDTPAAPLPDMRRDEIRWIVGPRYRLYTRASSDLTPYFDLFAQGTYGRNAVGDQSFRSVGARTGLGFGLEYFTRWSFSLAAHSDIVSLAWRDVREEAFVFLGPSAVYKGSDLEVRAGVQPVLFVRGYF